MGQRQYAVTRAFEQEALKLVMAGGHPTTQVVRDHAESVMALEAGGDCRSRRSRRQPRISVRTAQRHERPFPGNGLSAGTGLWLDLRILAAAPNGLGSGTRKKTASKLRVKRVSHATSFLLPSVSSLLTEVADGSAL